MGNLVRVPLKRIGKSIALSAAHSLLLAVFFGLVVTASHDARATGFVRLDSSSFLKSASDRGVSSSTLMIGPQFSSEGKLFKSDVDVQAISFLGDSSSLTVESQNAYIATSSQLMPHHQVTLGRRLYDWSVMDDEWKIGLWTPRFLWDPLRPEQVGLTGAFYTYESKNWRVRAYASAISIPERGAPTQDVNGQLRSSSPFYIPPYQYLLLQGQKTPMKYTVQYPPLEQLVLNPGAALSVGFGDKQGPWAQVVYGLVPINQIDISVAPAYVLQANEIDVPVHPRVLLHHMVTSEAGYKDKTVSVYSSLTFESPIKQDVPATWMTAPMGNSILASIGGSAMLEKFRLSSSFLYVYENLSPSSANSINVPLPSRYPYNRAIKFGGEYEGTTKLTYGTTWTSDLVNRSNLLSFDVNFRPGPHAPTSKSGAWLINVGTDFISSSTSQGQLGQYEGDDRVRGGVAYAF